jgi:hypothetical protein
MMWYNNGPRYRNGYRRGGFRGLYGLPWIIFGLIWWGHQSWFIIIPIIVLVIAFIAAMQMRRPNAPMGNQGQQYSNSYYTPPVYQPTPPEQPYYQPYGQGYQEQRREQELKQEAEEYTPNEPQRSSEQDYEAPRAEYPQQMPPME